MRYTPRRRRGDEEQHEGGGLPVIPLVIIVVFAGLLLGGLLAHFFGSGGSGAQQAMSPSLVSPIPSPTMILSPTPFVRHRHTPAPKPATTPSATPSPSLKPSAAKPVIQAVATATPTANAQPEMKATPIIAPVATQLPVVITASPQPPPPPRVAPAPAASARPVAMARVAPPHHVRGMQTGDPTDVVRAYLNALSHGNESQASSYLESGEPAEPFMRNAHIVDMQSANNGDGTYLVSADVHARSGKYRVTFTVAALPEGMVITDHFYVKPR